jgi:hypothetical protein
MKDLMIKLFIVITMFLIGFAMNIWNLIVGWGLTPRNWVIIIFTYVFTIIFMSIAQYLIKD